MEIRIPKSYVEIQKGMVYFQKGEIERCKKHLNNFFNYALKEYDQYAPNIKTTRNFIFGILDLKEGHIDSAKARLAEMKSLWPELTTTSREELISRYHLLLGEILLAEGSSENAIAELQKYSPSKLPLLQSFEIIGYNTPLLIAGLARAYLQNGELEKAIEEYERLITFDPSSNNRRLIHPLLHYQLAKLYEEKGSSGKAIAEYEKFLEFCR